MPAHFLHVIDAHGLRSWQRNGRQLSSCARFDGFGDASAQLFHDWLGTQSRSSRHAVLTDLAEERFALERIPRIGGADRRALIRRKLGQHFPDTPYTTSIPLGRHDGGPAMHRVLLGALTRPALLTPWLEAFDRAGAALTRITSAPLLLDQWNRRMLRNAGNFLLLTLTVSGMRLTLFDRGRLRLSRVIPPRGASLTACEPFYRHELAQTRAYLAAQRLAGHDDRLKLVALSGPSDRPIVQGIIGGGGDLDARFEDLGLHVRRPLADDAADDSDTLPLLLEQLMHRPSPEHYTPPALHRAHTLARLRRGMVATASLASALCVVSAGAHLAELGPLAREIDAHAHETRVLERSEAALAHSLPRLPAPLPSIEAWFAEYDRHVARQIPPHPILQQISALLETEPMLQIDSLRWRAAAPQRDAALLSATATGPAPRGYVVVDIDARLPLSPDNAGAPGLDALLARLQHALGPALQIRAATEGAGTPPNLPPDAGSGNSVDTAPRLTLRLALPIAGTEPVTY